MTVIDKYYYFNSNGAYNYSISMNYYSMMDQFNYLIIYKFKFWHSAKKKKKVYILVILNNYKYRIGR